MKRNSKYSQIVIGLLPETIEALNDLAKKKGVSRTALIRMRLMEITEKDAK